LGDHPLKRSRLVEATVKNFAELAEKKKDQQLIAMIMEFFAHRMPLFLTLLIYETPGPFSLREG